MATATVEVIVDATPPVIELTPGATAVAVKATDAETDVARTEWSIDGGPFQPLDPVLGIPLRPGMNRLTVRSVDLAGNVGTVTRDVVRDTTKPALKVVTPAMVVGRKATITVTATDAGSGLSAIEYGTKRFTSGTMKMVVPSGRRIYVGAVDRAGNRSVAYFTVQRAKSVPKSTRLVWVPGEPRMKNRQAILLRSVQDQLKLLKKLPARAKPVDRYTRKLVKTVTGYQKRSKLKATGVVDWPTRARLMRDLAKVRITVVGR